MTKLPTIDTGSEPDPLPHRRRPRPLLFFAYGLLVFLALLVLFIFGDSLDTPVEQGSDRETRPQVPLVEAEEVPAAEADPPAPALDLIDDDGRTMWAPPTDGPPLDLAYLPPGVQIILALRPAALVAHPEGDKALAALGPLGQQGLRAVEQATGRPFDQLEQLLVGWQTNEDGAWEIALVARMSSEAKPGGVPISPLIRYEPPGHEGRVMVAALPAAIEDIKALNGRRPPLRRDMQRLVDRSDATRDVTLLVAPSFLFGDGHTLFSGEAARLRGPVFWFLGDGLGAVSLSLQWDEDFFVELCAMPTLDALPHQVAEEFLDRVRQLPDLVEEYVISLNPQPYGRRVVLRLPAMVRKLVTHSRASYDGDEATLRCYLPAIAGHNLLMAAELTLAESTTTNTPTARPLQSLGTRRGERPGTATSVAERLQKRTSLRFPSDTLEAALDMLAQDVGVEIILSGRDLQLEGITKNQSFGLDLRDRPAQEILVEILRLANPDKSASGPSDERQKLVYVVKPREPGQPDAVFITTRSQARQRGDRLPDVFIPQ
jgi:hypothetical protein